MALNLSWLSSLQDDVGWTLQNDDFPRHIALPFELPQSHPPPKRARHAGDPSFCTIESKYHAKSGLTVSKQDIMLYGRLAFRHQAAYLQKYAIEYCALCWVIGPLGCGKSCEAFAFALSLDPLEWNVIWIHHARQRRSFQCVRFEGSTKMTLEIPEEDLRRFKLLFNREQLSSDDNKKSIVFWDGYTNSSLVAGSVLSYCTVWRVQNRSRHRLVCVCSMVKLGMNYRPYKFHSIQASDNTEYLEHQDWKSWSWSLEEYLVAVKNDDFYDSVKAMLGYCSRSQSNRNELVRSKYDIAGVNAYFMFRVTTTAVIEYLVEIIRSAEKLTDRFHGRLGDGAAPVNQLLCSQWLDANTRTYHLLSRFVARELAIRFGPNMVVHLKKALVKNHVEIANEGYLLEMCFFAQLTHTSVALEGRVDVQSTTWTRPTFLDMFDPTMRMLNVEMQEQHPMWLRPIKWDQGGYDAVYLEKATGLVRFVQVTSTESHSFDPQVFLELLTKLAGKGQRAESALTVQCIELCHVVPRSVLNTFVSLDEDTFNNEVVERFNRNLREPRLLARGQINVYGLNTGTIN